MKIEYSSNNSGGRWWLKDEDWKALEDAGWEVIWGGWWFCRDKYSTQEKPVYLKEECPAHEQCNGHRVYTSYEMAKASGSRWLGSLAREATVDRPSIEEAIREFEQITGQDAEAQGCNCCGQPHGFLEV